jgi:hypothetical protein
MTTGSSESKHVWGLLTAGGAVVSREVNEEGGFRFSFSKYSPLADPRAAMGIASLLATAAVELTPSVVVAWEELEDTLLAFAVGAELGIPVIRALDFEGLVRYSGSLPAHPRGVLVTDALRENKAIEAVKALLRQMGGGLSGVVTVVDIGDVVWDLSVKSLVSASDAPIVEDKSV